MGNSETRAAEIKLMNTIASDRSISRAGNIDSARMGLKLARGQDERDTAYRQASADRYKNTPNQQMSSGSPGDSVGGLGGIWIVALAGIIWVVEAIVQFVAFVCTWLAHHIWNIVGAGMVIGGIYCLYLLAAHYYWKYRN